MPTDHDLDPDDDIVMLPARPEPIAVPASKAAIIVIDMQNAYASKGGYLDLAGFDISGAAKVIENTKQVLDVARAAGVQVTVINGITAGLAGVTSLGVPLTHREHAHGVIFITGHAQHDAADRVDWSALGQTATQAKLTLVIYMGISGAEPLQQALIQNMRPDTPVAVIHQVSLPQQRHVVCELQQLYSTIQREEMASPSVIVVGDVFKGLLALQAQPATKLTA